MKKAIKLLFLLILGTAVGFAQQNPNEGKSHFDKEKWVEYIEGNIPLVISVPHGGRVTSDTLPTRDCKGAIRGVDGGSMELAMAIRDYFKKTYKVTPHLIISHIARKHVDQNRELENGATCGYKPNEKPWYTFHNWVDSALNLVTANGNRAMYIDLHSHGHENQRLEIGYNLTSTELQAILDGSFNDKKKYHSLTNLLKAEKSLDFKEMLFGDKAFGTLLVNNGVLATPSKQDLVPKTGEKFFSGGDNTRRFTGKKYPNVFGLQIECDKTSRANRAATAKGISQAVVEYLNMYAKTQINTAKK